MIRPVVLRRLSAYRYPVNSRGSILIVVLWSLCLLSVFAVIMGYQVRQELSLVKRLDENCRGRLIAEAGVKTAIASLKKEEAKSYNSFQDAWSGFGAVNNFKDVKIGDGRFTICYNYTNEKMLVSQPLYGLIDEERKININTSDMNTIKRLFMLVMGMDDTESQDLAASIVDWRDADSNLSIPLGSAEDSYYKLLPYPYTAKNGPFEVIDELLLVKGVSLGVFNRIKDFVTLYGAGRVNVNTAGRPVLEAVGISDRIASYIIDFRYGKDNMPGTADDGFFDSQANIVPRLSQSFNLSSSEVGELTAIVEKSLSVYSDNFTIKSYTKFGGANNAIDVDCVINRNGKILYWQER